MHNKRSFAPLYWGLGLLALGVFFVLFTFDVLTPYEEELIWGMTGVLGLTGLGFLAYTLWRPRRWWFLVPGFLLLSMATVVYLATQARVAGPILASVIFLGLGLAHVLIFLTDRRERWWAWVVGGSFLVLTAAVLWGGEVSAPVLSAGLFLGMGVVFFLLYVVLPADMPRWWALLLAAAFVVTAAFVFTVSAGPDSLLARGWAIALTLLGIALIGWFVSRSFLRAAPPPVTPSPPSEPPPLLTPEGSVVPVPDEVPPRVSPEREGEPAAGEVPPPPPVEEETTG